MTQKNSVLNRQTRYVSGGTTEVNRNALEWWERIVMPLGTDDQTYVVEQKFQGRLDLIATIYLAEPRYWWIIAQYNNVLDPVAEITTGRILYIPSVARVNDMIAGKVGGVASTREVPTTVLPIV